MKKERSRLTNQADAVRAMIAEVRKEPYVEDTRLVLADWLEEKGFSHAATTLRKDPDETGPDLMICLSAIRALLGEDLLEEPGRSLGRYTAVVGFPTMVLPAADTISFEGTSHIAFQLRRMVLPSHMARGIKVLDVRLGIQMMFLNSEPVDGALFVLHGPETFDAKVYPGQRIVVTLRNETMQDMLLGPTLLGKVVTEERALLAGPRVPSDVSDLDPPSG